MQPFRFTRAILAPLIFGSLLLSQGQAVAAPDGASGSAGASGISAAREAVYRDMAASGNATFLTGSIAALMGAGVLWGGFLMEPGETAVLGMRLQPGEVSAGGLLTMWGGIAAMGIGAGRVREAAQGIHPGTRIAGRPGWPLYVTGLALQLVGFTVLAKTSRGNLDVDDTWERVSFGTLVAGQFAQGVSAYQFSMRRSTGNAGLAAFAVIPEVKTASQGPHGMGLRLVGRF